MSAIAPSANPAAIGYVRVSTEGQAVEGISLDAQQAKINAWAQYAGYSMLEIRIDAGISGKRADNRPGLQAAIDAACQHKAALVVYSLSRLARSTRDAIDISDKLEKAGADLVSLSEKIDTTSAAGKMVFRLFASLAEFERDQISERTRLAMQHLRKNSKRVGTIPFGFTLLNDGETLIEHAGEQTVIETMRKLHSESKSLRQIAAALTTLKMRSKSGKPWTAESIRGILNRKEAA